MPVGHAAAKLVDQFPHGDARRRQLHAGIFDPPRNRVTAQTKALIAAVALPPARALLDDVAHPPQRLDIVDQRRQSEQPDLERIWRLVPRQSTLALDAFEQRGFLAADIGAGAAPHMQPRPARRQFRDLARQEFARGRIFVADVDVDLARLDDMGADQRTLEKAMRIGLEIITVLERSGFALIAVDGHQPGAWLAQHRAPFAPRREARAAEAAQGSMVERLEQIFPFQFTRTQAVEQLVAATGDIGVVAD